MNATLLSPLLAAFLFAPQEDPGRAPGNANPYTPNHPAYAAYANAVQASDLGVDVFTPRYASPMELAVIAGEVVGTTVAVRDDVVGTDLMPRSRFNPIGRSIAVVDEADARIRLLKILTDLDMQIGAEEIEQLKRQAENAPTTVTYTPKHISITTAHGALMGNQMGMSSFRIEATPLYEVGTLLLRGSADEIRSALELVQEIDRPRAQILLTIYAIGAADSANGASTDALPGELVDGLRQLVPGSSFELLGSASVRTTVSGESVMLESTLRDGEELSFSTEPSAFDEASGRLTLGDCKLNVSARRESGGANRDVRVSTSVAVEVGEYVVMAAAGSAQTYFVVHTHRG